MFVFQYKNDIPILLVDADVDITNVDDFDAAIEKLEGQHENAAMISLEQCPFVCVHAFSILCLRASRAAARGKQLIVISPERSFHRKILGLLRFPYDIAQDVEHGLSMLRRPGSTLAQT
jgi:hypothetical protein